MPSTLFIMNEMFQPSRVVAWEIQPSRNSDSRYTEFCLRVINCRHRVDCGSSLYLIQVIITSSHESGHFEWRKKGETIWTKKEIQCLSFTCFMSIVTSFKVFAQ